MVPPRATMSLMRRRSTREERDRAGERCERAARTARADEAACDTACSGGRRGEGPRRGFVKRILLVEDEARVRKLIVDVLTSHGYNVVEATRGEEAIRLCKEHNGEIDLAVVDVVMPEMSGPGVVKEIAALCPDIRVLYISGYTDEAIVHHGIPQSGAAFLQKPFMPNALAHKVREVLDSRSNSAC